MNKLRTNHFSSFSLIQTVSRHLLTVNLHCCWIIFALESEVEKAGRRWGAVHSQISTRANKVPYLLYINHGLIRDRNTIGSVSVPIFLNLKCAWGTHFIRGRSINNKVPKYNEQSTCPKSLLEFHRCRLRWLSLVHARLRFPAFHWQHL